MNINEVTPSRSGEPADRDTQIASLYYYLYRQAGSPMGDTLCGLNAWCNIQFECFRELCGLNGDFDDGH